jgi:hypothetical protein
MFRVAFVLTAVLGVAGDGAAGRADEKKEPEFITKAGTYKLHSGKLVVTVTAGNTGSGFKFNQPREKGSTEYGSGDDAIKKGADWFIYPESPDRVWVFTGTDFELWEMTDEGVAVKDAAAPKIVKAVPEVVRKRLPAEFRKKLPQK